MTLDQLNAIGVGKLPGYLGIVVVEVGDRSLRGELVIRPHHLAPNGYLHAGTVVTLADTCAGYACRQHLPPTASGFTTIELKSNHLGTALEGTLGAHATAVHLGRNTHVWDAVVTHKDSGKTLAMFRCTQMILYGKPAGTAPSSFVNG